MTVTRAEVEELHDLVAGMPRFERLAPAEELVRAADALGDDELRFRARLLFVESSHYANARHRMFAPFVFVLQHYDAGPAWLTLQDRYRVLWVHKWMVSQLVAHPQVPLEQLESALDGMRRRYAAIGEGLGPVLGCAYELRAHVHGAEAAQAEFEAWRRAPRTRLSDCAGCEPSTRIQHHAALGHHEDAVAELAPVLSGDITCPEQPQVAVSRALASVAAVGDAEKAAALHRSAYRASRRNPSHTGPVATHLHVLARSGEVGRGLDVLAEQLGALERPSDPFAGMELAAAGARLLRVVVDAGDADLPVGGRGRAPERAADLLERLEREALAAARLFDERNGTSTVGDHVRAMLSAPDLPPLGLGPVGGPPGAAGAPLPAIDLPRVPEHPALRGDVDLAGLDVPRLADLVATARQHAHTPTWDRLAVHWRSRRAQELTVLDTADEVRVRAAADLDAFGVWRSTAPEPELAASAARLYRTLGDEPEAVLVELLDDLHAGRDVDHAAVLAAVDGTGTPGQRARARARLAADAADADAVRLRAEALELLRPVVAPGPDERGLAAWLLVAYPPEGRAREDLHAQALALLADGEAPDTRVHVLEERAAACAEDGDTDGALALLDEAAATARRAGAPTLVLQVESTRYRVLAAAGDADAVERHALAAAAAALAEGLPDLAVDARAFAASLLAHHGRELEAIELVEATLAIPFPDDVVPRAHRSQRTGRRVHLLDLGSRLSSALGEGDRAVALAREALTLAQGPDGGTALAAGALHRLAGLVEGDDAVEAARLYGQALDAARAAGLEALALVVCRERVWARFDADGLDAALQEVEDAVRANEEARARTLVDPAVAEALDGWDFDHEELTLRTLSARVLAQGDEPDRALAALDGLPARWEALGVPAAALDAELVRGALLLEVGRDVEGIATLDAAATRAREAGQPGLSRQAAGTAARWLDDAGRPDEAEALWQRHAGEDPGED